MRCIPTGDVAVCVELGDEISEPINTRVRALEFLIHERALPGVVEMVPSFRSLLVYYDPLVIDHASLVRSLEALALRAETATLPPARRVELPCCYGGDLGPDLEGAATRLGLSPEELVHQHAGATYLVYFIGFTPGLPYMDLPRHLHIPRLESPRTKVPPGSVGIGGPQCCIYSVESPGGYWLLGTTPLRLYDPDGPEPILLRPGDRVTFRPVDRGEYDAILAAVEARTFRPVTL